jgi:RNA polymerase sigma factor (sigma-70 family)
VSEPFLGIEHRPFNFRLREARLALGLSRAALAAASGVSPTTVGALEALKAWPSPGVASRIAAALRDDPEALFPPEVGVALRGRSARTTYSVLPMECLTLTDPSVALLEAPDAVAGEGYQGELAALLAEGLDKLPARERRVLEMRYGLNGLEPMTLRDVGLNLGASVERARQLEMQALRKMRHPARHRQLAGYGYEPRWDDSPPLARCLECGHAEPGHFSACSRADNRRQRR